jgi:uncharacterized protein (DUF302 family)
MTESLGFEVRLDQPYERAVDEVTAALKEQGFGILTKIDVKATLKEKLDKDFRPYVILGACNPPLAYRALSQNPEIGIMLPCNVTVEATDGGGSLVRVSNPDLFMQVGNLHEDEVMQEVAHEAKERVMRVVEKLRNS